MGWNVWIYTGTTSSLQDAIIRQTIQTYRLDHMVARNGNNGPLVVQTRERSTEDIGTTI